MYNSFKTEAMKTQIFTKHISKALLLAMVIALAAPTANGQRREVSGNEKSQKAEQQKNQHHPSTDHNNKIANKNNNDWHKTHANKHWDRPAKVHVYVHPPVINNWGVYSYHHQPICFRRVPKKSMWVNLDGENYLMYKNRFYLPGPLGFYRVSIPKFINELPEGCSLVLIKGQKFYNFHGILFIDTPLGFRLIAS